MLVGIDSAPKSKRYCFILQVIFEIASCTPETHFFPKQGYASFQIK